MINRCEETHSVEVRILPECKQALFSICYFRQQLHVKFKIVACSNNSPIIFLTEDSPYVSGGFMGLHEVDCWYEMASNGSIWLPIEKLSGWWKLHLTKAQNVGGDPVCLSFKSQMRNLAGKGSIIPLSTCLGDQQHLLPWTEESEANTDIWNLPTLDVDFPSQLYIFPGWAFLNGRSANGYLLMAHKVWASAIWAWRRTLLGFIYFILKFIHY